MTQLLVMLVLSFAVAGAQSVTSPSLHGTVTDPSGASVPGAVVELRGRDGEKRARTDTSGKYSFTGFKPGTYKVRIAVKGFATVERNDLLITTGTIFDVRLAIRAGKEIVDVQADGGRISAEPASNGGGIFLGERQIAALSDDPDELALQLQALAGPAPGPNGGQIFVDGFTGVNLPPKASIREIRINANPFSPEYDRPGFSRIEIFTKPGSDSIRGQAFTQFNDEILNSRNPLLAQSKRPPYGVRIFGFDISGPLKRNKASLTLGVERRDTGESGFVLATTLDGSLNPTVVNQAVKIPQARTTATPKLDYALSPKNTLAVRYQELRTSLDDAGVGDFNLASRGYDEDSANRIVQMTETAVLSPKAINEIRFQFVRERTRQTARDFSPAINVQGAFFGGGAPVNESSSTTNSVEISNLSTYTAGRHTYKWSGRMRQSRVTDISRNNFAGSFTFLTLNDYQRTLAGEPGAGPYQFSISAGNPIAKVCQLDVGFFANDDWKARPNLTLSFGLRYEAQTNLGDLGNWAPRFGFAWGVDAKSNRPAKTVVRGGAGIFFDRVPVSVTMNALRYNGVTQRSYVIFNPGFFPAIPPAAVLAANDQPQQLMPVSSLLDTPRLIQFSIGIERQLTGASRISANWISSRGTRLLNIRNIDTPIGGAYPFGDRSIRLLTESAGMSRLNQLMITPNLSYKKLTLYGNYVLSYGRSNNEGLPADPYDLKAEWGPSSYGDVRHRFVAMASAPLQLGITARPFFSANSGIPYNITTGLDPASTGFPAARPALRGDPSCRDTRCFDLTPSPGTPIIGRNFGRGPASVNLGLRISRTWSFGGQEDGGGGAEFGGGPHGGSGGPPAGMLATSTGRKYNLTLGATTLNALNRANYAPPNGNLSSPYFGQYRSLGGLMVRAHGGGQAAYNRKIDFQLRFTF